MINLVDTQLKDETNESNKTSTNEIGKHVYNGNLNHDDIQFQKSNVRQKYLVYAKIQDGRRYTTL